MFRFAPLLALPFLLLTWNEAPFRVVSIEPETACPDPAASLHVTLSHPLATDSLTRTSVRLLDDADCAVDCTFVTDLGRILTVTPVKPLAANRRYRLELSSELRSVEGTPRMPHCQRFTTGRAPSPTKRGVVQFRKERLDRAEGVCCVCIGPDRHLYAATFSGCLWRYRLDPATGRSRQRQTLAVLPERRITGLTFAPGSSADRLTLWMTSDAHAKEARPDMSFSGTLSRWQIPVGEGKAVETPVIVGLPAGAHPLSSPVFGPDGRLYLSQASITYAGAATEQWHETPLSAAVLVADVNREGFNGGKLPLDVRTEAPIRYDPNAPGAPLRVYATGIREAFDLCWHSNGRLYAVVTMNDTPNWTPCREDVPALFENRPDEQLICIRPGVFYGFPNPAIGRHVLLGGNPTAGKDPWEVPEYPVGVRPEPDFQPGLLLYNLAKVGGDSANGCVEYPRPGPWQGRLLICFYTKRRAIGSFRFSREGLRVEDFQVVSDRRGREIPFASPLDLTTDSDGRLYVADFTFDGQFDSGKEGGIWLLTPEE